MNKIKSLFSNRHSRRGSYSIGITVIVVAIVMILNLILGRLPENIKNLDISSSKIYTTGETTKEVLENLDKKVVIHVIAEDSKIDSRIRKFIDKYAAMSKFITVETIDPVLHPSVLKEYNVEANSVVVTCEDTNKSTSFSFGDMIVFDQMSYYYYGQYVETEFDGEGQLTSAVDYVTNEVNKKIYTTQGHGEAALSGAVTDLIDKQNFEASDVNLIQSGAVPEDCDLLLINAASSDLADDELKMISEYMDKGGKLMLFIGDTDKETPNLDSLLADYGLKVVDGYIADGERYYQNSMFNVFPVYKSGSEVCQGLTDDDLSLIVNAKGMEQITPKKEKAELEAFMTTSENGIAVTETEQKQGTYLLGAVVTNAVDDTTASRLTVISAASLINEQITSAFSNLSNLQLFMNAVTSNFEDVQNISIEAKSLEVNNNTVASAGMYGALFIGVIPVIILVYGFVVWMRRRKA